MKLDALLERAELLPRSSTPKAEAIAKQFVATAVKGVESKDVEALAKKLAKGFYDAMIASIDQDVKNRNTKVIK